MTRHAFRGSKANRDCRDVAFARGIIAEATRRHNVQTTNVNPLARPDPNHQVVFRPTRPDFSITFLSGTSTNRGYHESYYEVIGRRELKPEDFARLDACGLLGMGQCYGVFKSDTFTEEVQPSVVDRLTGLALPDAKPVAWNGEPFVGKTSYTYYRYQVRRICDSGD